MPDKDIKVIEIFYFLLEKSVFQRGFCKEAVFIPSKFATFTELSSFCQKEINKGFELCVGIKTKDAIIHLDLCLLLFAHRDKVLCHVSHVHHAGRVLEDIVLFLLDDCRLFLIHFIY